MRPSAKSILRNGSGRVQGRRLLFICLMLTLLVPILPAFANSGPPRILPDQNQVIFKENPGIALNHEFISIEWLPERYNAEFTITYTFENTEESPQALTLWFMSGDYEDQSFKITRVGTAVPTKDIEPDAYHLSNWTFEREPPFLTPFNEPTAKNLDFYGQTQTPARITEWVLELAAHEQAEVVVVYEARSGYLNNSDYFAVYRTLYYALSPAEFFDGDAVLDLELIVPENWSAAANLPLKLEAPGRYTLRGYKIGSDDLYVSLLNKNEMMFGLNSRAVLFNRTWPIAFVSFIAAAVLFRRKKHVALGLVFGGGAALLINLIRPTYGMLFMMIIFLPIVVVILALLAAVLIVIRWRRKKNAEDTPQNGSKSKDWER